MVQVPIPVNPTLDELSLLTLGIKLFCSPKLCWSLGIISAQTSFKRPIFHRGSASTPCISERKKKRKKKSHKNKQNKTKQKKKKKKKKNPNKLTYWITGFPLAPSLTCACLNYTLLVLIFHTIHFYVILSEYFFSVTITSAY